MDYIIGILLFVGFVLYLLAQDSKKDTKKEKYGEAIGELAQMTADSVSSIARELTESGEKKTLRLAKEDLASRNGRIYRMDWSSESDNKYLNQLLTVDESFKKSLEVLGLTEKRWKVLAWNIFYIGILRVNSRDSFDYSKKNTESLRKHMVYEWCEDDFFKSHSEMICKACKHFNINISEWIKYGDTVIEMYDLLDGPDMDEFGIKDKIMPMKNNKHLL